MPRYMRAVVPGGTFFFTVVTGGRDGIFRNDEARRLLREAFDEVLAYRPVETVAFVLLPEHLHCIWTLPEGDNNFSIRWKRIKEIFTKKYESSFGDKRPVSDAAEQRGESGLWQRRFWEHTVRDEEELERLCEYIHYNPVKHGLVKCPHSWPYSTFHRFVKQELYPQEWGCCCERKPEISEDWLSNESTGDL